MKIKYEIIEVDHMCLDTTVCYTTTDLKEAFEELEIDKIGFSGTIPKPL